MSHLRNRMNPSCASVIISRKKPFNKVKPNSWNSERLHSQTVTSLTDIPQYKKRPKAYEEVAFNQNLHLYRELFNQNDKSQLPFMSTLRSHRKNNEPPKPTISEAFEVSLKTTCNQTVRKRISDFQVSSRRMATSYYRWHNKTGRNSLWSTNFQCSLRYNQDNPQEKDYYNYIKPIIYKDTEQKIYDKKEMICDRHQWSFSVK